MMMSPGMCATTRRSFDWAESVCSGPIHMDRSSSSQSIVLVCLGNRSSSESCCHRKLLVPETIFLAMARACSAEVFSLMDDFNLFLSSDFFFGFQGGTITATAETGAEVQPGKFKRKSGIKSHWLI